MSTPIRFLLGLLNLGASYGGRHEVAALVPHAGWTLVAGVAVLVHSAIRLTYHRPAAGWPAVVAEPSPLRLGWSWYPRALISWLDAFATTYAVAPGLYYTGVTYDRDTPLLVTSNYRLTLFLLLRRLRGQNVRLLVVDTEGINVWCAAGKGRFGNTEILRQVERYDRELLTGEHRLRLILPKLGMAGVDVRALRRQGISPVIGPVYARDLPAYLRAPPLRDQKSDRVRFGLLSRAFTWLPGLVQTLYTGLIVVLVLLGTSLISAFRVPLGLLALMALVSTAYPLLFPWIPGRRFAVKGLWLAAGVVAGLAALSAAGLVLSWSDLPAAAPLTLALGLFFGLAYTGNSAVSNYTRVRAEIARFLPLDVLLFAAAIAAMIVTEAHP